jgi:catechol 2,3-dioxygenase
VWHNTSVQEGKMDEQRDEHAPGPPGPALPDDARIGTVRLQVADLGRSVDYYSRILGMAAVHGAAGSATLGPDGGPALIVLHERPGARRVPRHGRLGLYHFALLLPSREDLGRFSGHLQRLGVPAGASDHLVSEALYLHDPDGLGIEVYADRPRSSWRFHDGQLVMDTRPLDTHDLLRAAGSAAWSGMPTGSTMGHIHLHVDDLDAASRFYEHTLGFQRTVWGYPGALFLSAGGYHHHVGLNTWAAGAPPAGDDDARLLEWELVLGSDADVDAVLDRAATTERTLHDPWGCRVRITTA